MKIRSTLAGVTIALALTACSSAPTAPESTDDASDAAGAFLACLTAAGVEAKINDNGMVLVKLPPQPSDSGEMSIGSDDGRALIIEGDSAGNSWVAAADASYFTDDPDTQDAYRACEAQHPAFAQPQYDPADDPRFQADIAKQEEAALAFAQCARANGYAQIADPDPQTAPGAIMIPDDFTEADFRALAEACYDPNSTFAFGTSDGAAFEPWTILDELQNAPAS